MYRPKSGSSMDKINKKYNQKEIMNPVFGFEYLFSGPDRSGNFMGHQ